MERWTASTRLLYFYNSSLEASWEGERSNRLKPDRARDGEIMTMLSFVASAVLHALVFYGRACFWGLWSVSLEKAQAYDS